MHGGTGFKQNIWMPGAVPFASEVLELLYFARVGVSEVGSRDWQRPAVPHLAGSSWSTFERAALERYFKLPPGLPIILMPLPAHVSRSERAKALLCRLAGSPPLTRAEREAALLRGTSAGQEGVPRPTRVLHGRRVGFQNQQ